MSLHVESALADAPATARVAVRFGVSVAANVTRMAVSFLAGILVARGLGASGYGDLQFLLGSFAAVRQLLDMGTSSGFYTFLARRKRRPAFLGVWIGWLACQFSGTVLVVAMLLPRPVFDRVWLGQERSIVLLAFLASFLMNEAWGMVVSLGEARRRTVIVQAAVLLQALAHLGLVASAVHWGWLTVPTALLFIVAEYGLLVVALAPAFLRANVASPDERDQGVAAALRQLAAYCRPLVVAHLLGFVYFFADRWLLQEFGRSQQQGFYAIGVQCANASVIAASSVANVMWKEFATAWEHEDLARLRALYRVFTRGLFAAAAWISCFVVPYSRDILLLTAGPAYEAASLPLALLSLSAIHQALGYVTTTYMYATGATDAYTRINLASMAISIPLTYLLLATPSSALPGLGLGAVGLAIKTILIAVVVANALGYVIARGQGVRHAMFYQGSVIAALLAAGWLARVLGQALLDTAGVATTSVAGVLAGGVVYAILSLAMVYLCPALMGFSRAEIIQAISRLRRGGLAARASGV